MRDDIGTTVEELRAKGIDAPESTPGRGLGHHDDSSAPGRRHDRALRAPPPNGHLIPLARAVEVMACSVWWLDLGISYGFPSCARFPRFTAPRRISASSEATGSGYISALRARPAHRHVGASHDTLLRLPSSGFQKTGSGHPLCDGGANLIQARGIGRGNPASVEEEAAPPTTGGRKHHH
jgi:hypothetical protein